jgi:hypothetical protein
MTQLLVSATNQGSDASTWQIGDVIAEFADGPIDGFGVGELTNPDWRIIQTTLTTDQDSQLFTFGPNALRTYRIDTTAFASDAQTWFSDSTRATPIMAIASVTVVQK